MMGQYIYFAYVAPLIVSIFLAGEVAGQNRGRENSRAPSASTSSIEKRSAAGWPKEIQEIRYLSAADQSMQPALFYDPGGDTPKPLLIALHTWSSDYRQPNPAYGLWCIAKGWVMMHPNFRGINETPESCGSDLAVADIVSAVEHAKRVSQVDSERIYLIGASGGGYASLLMAGRAPEIWAGVSAWCPIFDLSAWHRETLQRRLRYAGQLEKVCGGPPGISESIDAQYRHRSANTWLPQAKNVHVSINTGITDGHDGSVPISHTLLAFNCLAAPPEQIPLEDIEKMTSGPKMPSELLQKIDDPLFQRKPALFRRISNNCQATIFQGGHEILYEAGLGWLEQQRKSKPPVWNITTAPDVDLNRIDTQSGK